MEASKDLTPKKEILASLERLRILAKAFENKIFERNLRVACSFLQEPAGSEGKRRVAVTRQRLAEVLCTIDKLKSLSSVFGVVYLRHLEEFKTIAEEEVDKNGRTVEVKELKTGDLIELDGLPYVVVTYKEAPVAGVPGYCEKLGVYPVQNNRPVRHPRWIERYVSPEEPASQIKVLGQMELPKEDGISLG